ncbi:MAG TPA: 2OG-Fe(II) oxygenase family protein [Lichenihabitans sp.]|jgi:isopenicillin N synthase-like dioxygenase|nr:2OG-Fe(II) oxygenase family protein [Lichenihabitans sp.]
MMAGLPIVDLSGLAEAADAGDAGRLRGLAQAFDTACRDFGFCYIVNHGVSQGLIDDAVEASAAFHAHPLADKQAIAINQAHRGYMAMASSVIVTSSIEKATKPNLSESFMLMHEVAPGTEQGPLDGPNQWPTDLPGFRPAIEAYDAALGQLARRMTRMIAVALGLEPAGLDRYFDRPTTFLRLLHYPPSPPQTDVRQYGSAPHTDYGFITILAQDRAGGLQVRSLDHEWIEATPIDGTFVVNIGDMGSRWTNGRWRSTPHRVINRSGGERYSMPYFYDPGAADIIACLPTCCSASEPARFPPVRYGDYLMERIDANYAYRAKSGA